MQEDGAATVVIAPHGTRGAAEKASVQFGPNHERYSASVQAVESGTSKAVALNIAATFGGVAPCAVRRQTSGPSASPSRTTTLPMNYRVEWPLTQRGMSALRIIGGRQRVDSAMSNIRGDRLLAVLFLTYSQLIYERRLADLRRSAPEYCALGTSHATLPHRTVAGAPRPLI